MGRTCLLDPLSCSLKNVAHCSVNIVMSTLNGHHVHFWTVNTQSGHWPRCLEASHRLRAVGTITQESLQHIWNYAWRYKKYASWWHQASIKLQGEVLRRMQVEPSALRTTASKRWVRSPPPVNSPFCGSGNSSSRYFSSLLDAWDARNAWSKAHAVRRSLLSPQGSGVQPSFFPWCNGLYQHVVFSSLAEI